LGHVSTIANTRNTAVVEPPNNYNRDTSFSSFEMKSFLFWVSKGETAEDEEQPTPGSAPPYEEEDCEETATATQLADMRGFTMCNAATATATAAAE
jgi:hypothetical protein